MKSNRHPLQTIATIGLFFFGVAIFTLARNTLFKPSPDWLAFWKGLPVIITLCAVGGGIISLFIAIDRYSIQRDRNYKSVLDVLPFTVRVHWLMQGLLLLVAFIAVGIAVWLIARLSIIGISIAIALLLVAWYCWALAKSTIYVNEQIIAVNVPHGRFQLRWDEVKVIVTNDALFSFQGNDKRLSTSLGLAGSGKAKFYDYTKHQIESRKISVEFSETVPLSHWNTRL